MPHPRVGRALLAPRSPRRTRVVAALPGGRSLRLVTRRVWVAVAVVALVLVIGYLAYDWTRPCVGGPVKRFVLVVLNGGPFAVRCAG